MEIFIPEELGFRRNPASIVIKWDFVMNHIGKNLRNKPADLFKYIKFFVCWLESKLLMDII